MIFKKAEQCSFISIKLTKNTLRCKIKQTSACIDGEVCLLTAALASAILAFFSRVLAASRSKRFTCSSFRSFWTQITTRESKIESLVFLQIKLAACFSGHHLIEDEEQTTMLGFLAELHV